METVKDLFSDKHKPNRGVICDVKNCSYNNGHSQCTAQQISVGPQSACCCSETVCATFRQKDK